MSHPPNDVIKTLSEEARSRECAFCLIATNSPAFDPTAAPESNGDGGDNSSGRAHIVLSTPDVIAFLDIMPLTRCHLLVCPRTHREKLSHLSPAENAVVGAWLPILSRAACCVSGYSDFNVVQNNGTILCTAGGFIVLERDFRVSTLRETECGHSDRKTKADLVCLTAQA
jgi:diadenosine tetraphosphate (Ap4A) HIT family hydrolase